MIRLRNTSVISRIARPKYKQPKKTAKKEVNVSKYPTLKKGSSGKYVKTLQKKLKIKQDGIFGADTLKAVKKFQKKHGLTVDGVVGKKTWTALLK
jgi:peptidoglycan hydrolase-like protein with peptidoglycan-binding domain